MIESPDRYAESLTIFMKIVGAVVAVISFRWLIKIWAGPDGKFSVKEFLKFAGFCFFISVGAFMIYKEGTRDHEWNYYSEWYIAIVFGSLLTVLHLDTALDKIASIIQAFNQLKNPPASEQKETV